MKQLVQFLLITLIHFTNSVAFSQQPPIAATCPLYLKHLLRQCWQHDPNVEWHWMCYSSPMNLTYQNTMSISDTGKAHITWPPVRRAAGKFPFCNSC